MSEKDTLEEKSSSLCEARTTARITVPSGGGAEEGPARRRQRGEVGVETRANLPSWNRGFS